MQLIKRLPHDAREMENAIIGWDIFRCRDYKEIDKMATEIASLEDMQKIKPILGYTVILAFNIKYLKFFKRLFIRTT